MSYIALKRIEGIDPKTKKNVTFLKGDVYDGPDADYLLDLGVIKADVKEEKPARKGAPAAKAKRRSTRTPV